MRTLVPSGGSSRLVSPYSSFTELYDFLIGNPTFPTIQKAFAHSVRRFGLEFQSIADVGCGTGRFLAELAHLPAHRIGADQSASALAVARRRLSGQQVLLLRQDIRRLSLPHRVDLMTCHNQTINYFTAADDLTHALQAIARNVRCGGAFLFDYIARIAHTPGRDRRRIRESIRLPDHDVDFDGAVDEARGVSMVRIRVTPKHARHCPTFEVHRQRWFSPSALHRLLGASGFRVLEMRPMDQQQSAWIHVVARRA
ncbi:class I SAM-dependent DNA methyltransferase [Bradyrhizobium sp.]